MEEVLKFQNALIKNYYKDLIISLNDDNVDFASFSKSIIYRGEEYLEKGIDLISKDRKYIIEDIKELYIKSISEVLLKLSNLPNHNEKLNFLDYIIQLFIIPIKQLKKDFHVYQEDSRYYSKPYPFYTLLSTNKLTEIVLKKKIKEEKGVYDIYELFDILSENKRDLTISFLPFSLFIIGSNFINILNYKVIEIQEDLEITEITESKLKWNGKASHLGFLIGQLAELDYINTPKRPNGDINYTHFAKEVLTTFHAKTTESTLTKYLNTSTEKAQETERSFKRANFNIPHKKEVS